MMKKMEVENFVGLSLKQYSLFHSKIGLHCILYCTAVYIRCSDLALLGYFLKSYTLLQIKYIFRRPIPKNRQLLPRERRTSGKVFNFLKYHRDLKHLYFLNICKNLPFTTRTIVNIENLKLNFCLFLSSQIGKTVFDMFKGKQNLFRLFCFVFMRIRIRIWIQDPKNFYMDPRR